MTRNLRPFIAAALAALALGCSISHPGVDAGPAPEDGATDAGPMWVPAERYCDRLEALGCSVACDVGTVCRRDRADACLDAVEASTDDCTVVPPLLSAPLCTDICE